MIVTYYVLQPRGSKNILGYLGTLLFLEKQIKLLLILFGIQTSSYKTVVETAKYFLKIILSSLLQSSGKYYLLFSMLLQRTRYFLDNVFIVPLSLQHTNNTCYINCRLHIIETFFNTNKVTRYSSIGNYRLYICAYKK